MGRLRGKGASDRSGLCGLSLIFDRAPRRGSTTQEKSAGVRPAQLGKGSFCCWVPLGGSLFCCSLRGLLSAAA